MSVTSAAEPEGAVGAERSQPVSTASAMKVIAQSAVRNLISDLF